MLDIDLQRYRLVDLSVTIEPPGSDDRPLEVSIGRLIDDAFKMDITRLHTHVGTYVEAPAHFFEGGRLITDFPPTDFLGLATLLSIEDPAEREVTGAIIDRHLTGVFEPGDILLCRNGIPDSRESPERAATLTADAARWIVEHGVKLLVVDRWFGLGRDIPEVREVHEIVMGRDVCIVEIVVLDGLRQPRCFFMSLPVAFALDSGFARAVAIEER
ncbi:MAG: cyclase family protein [Armatimonadota bacterium]